MPTPMPTLETTETTGRPPREVLEREHTALEAERRHLALHDPDGSRIAVVRDRLQVLGVRLVERALAERQAHDEHDQAERDAEQARVREAHARLEVFEAVEIPAAAREAAQERAVHGDRRGQVLDGLAQDRVGRGDGPRAAIVVDVGGEVGLRLERIGVRHPGPRASSLYRARYDPPATSPASMTNRQC